MSYKRIPRLYTPCKLVVEAKVSISKNDTNYLVRVLRLKQYDKVFLFNGLDGEWKAEISSIKQPELICIEKTKEQSITPTTILFFPIIKSKNLRFLIEKATELGVTDLYPTITEFTNIRTLNKNKLLSYMKESSELSERLDLPNLHEVMSLKDIVEKIEKDGNVLLFCDESRDKIPIKVILDKCKSNIFSFLVGPEGGFSDSERKYLQSSKGVQAVQLGKRILRAETAALAVLSLYKLGEY